MKITKIQKSLLAIIPTVVCILLLTQTTVANAGDNSRDNQVPPEALVTKTGKCEIDNVLDPSSPNYDPLQKYGPEGTRFGKFNETQTKIEDYQYFYGTYIYPDANIDGVLARQKISTTLTLDNINDTVFSPALLAPNNCRIESLASYVHNGASTQRYWKVWDHYNDCFIFATPMNTTFCNRYTNSGYVSTKIMKEGGYWVFYLYDWIDNEWDSPLMAYGNGDHIYGWDYWECWYLNVDNEWPDLPQIRSYDLSLHMNGNWILSTPTDSEFWQSTLPPDFPYARGFNSNYYDWYVGP